MTPEALTREVMNGGQVFAHSETIELYGDSWPFDAIPLDTLENGRIYVSRQPEKFLRRHGGQSD